MTFSNQIIACCHLQTHSLPLLPPTQLNSALFMKHLKTTRADPKCSTQQHKQSKWVLIVYSEGACLMWRRNVFHKEGAAVEKALTPLSSHIDLPNKHATWSSLFSVGILVSLTHWRLSILFYRRDDFSVFLPNCCNTTWQYVCMCFKCMS